jgi:hypothetical protein
MAKLLVRVVNWLFEFLGTGFELATFIYERPYRIILKFEPGACFS